jgi:hypothetical protein
MKTILIIGFSLLLRGLINAQSLEPGIAYAWISSVGISGYKLSNSFSIPKKEFSIDFGVEFILGRGNPNIEYTKDMKYNMELHNYHVPYVAGGYWHSIDTDVPANLKPSTTSFSQFNLNCGLRREVVFNDYTFIFKIGGSLSTTRTHFLIGPFRDADVIWTLTDINGNEVVVDSTKWDVMFPVNLRYINAGMYAGAEWLLFKDKATPVGVELKYYAGLKKKHIVTFGVNFHLPVKRPSES